MIEVYDAENPAVGCEEITGRAEQEAALAKAGMRFEKWDASREITAATTDAEIIEAYRADIDRLCREGGYKSVDVIHIRPDNPKKSELRAKFLNEHTHAEDEVRFFVSGSGLFFMHIGSKVFAVMCKRGDLISVPAGVTHWFDMGENPDFTAIRLFTNPEGWIANFTGSDIAAKFPTYEKFQG